MQPVRRFLCALFVVILLVPLSVVAVAADQQAYSDLFRSGTSEEWKKAFTVDPHLFVSALSEEKYSKLITVINTAFVPEDVKKNGDTYKQTLLTLARQNELNQAERRVVRWMLDKFGTEYDMWTEDVDYRELFSRCAEMDGALPAYFAAELKVVFLRDPYRFLQEMSVSDADLECLSTILMDRIYYGNYDRQEIEKLLQGMENSGKLNDLQLQMLQQLRSAVDGLINLYGPLPERPSGEEDISPTETPTEPVPKELDKKIWLLPCVGIGVLLIAVIVVVYI